MKGKLLIVPPNPRGSEIVGDFPYYYPSMWWVYYPMGLCDCFVTKPTRKQIRKGLKEVRRIYESSQNY